MRPTRFYSVILVLLVLGGGCRKGPSQVSLQLHRAAEEGDLQRVQSLIGAGADVNARDRWGETPVYYAVVHGHKEVVKRLIAEGANFKAKRNDGSTLLHVAARRGHADVTELLIANDLDVNQRKGWTVHTPLYIAIAHGRLKTAEVLIASGGAIGSDELRAAVQVGDRDMLALLIANDADVKHACRGTLLHTAVSYGRKAVAELLIAKSVDVNARDDIQGYTALHYAAQNDDPNFINLLVAAGAEVDANNDESDAPLHLAVFNCHVRAVKSLLAQGANANAIDRERECTPLMTTILYGRMDIAELLLAHGADINQKGRSGGACLHVTALGSDPNVVRFLVARGADVNAKDKDGATPLHKAAQYASTKMAAVFIENGADVNALATNGQTPLDFAYETDKSRKRGLVDLLIAAGGKGGTEVRR